MASGNLPVIRVDFLLGGPNVTLWWTPLREVRGRRVTMHWRDLKGHSPTYSHEYNLTRQPLLKCPSLIYYSSSSNGNRRESATVSPWRDSRATVPTYSYQRATAQVPFLKKFYSALKLTWSKNLKFPKVPDPPGVHVFGHGVIIQTHKHMYAIFNEVASLSLLNKSKVVDVLFPIR